MLASRGVSRFELQVKFLQLLFISVPACHELMDSGQRSTIQVMNRVKLCGESLAVAAATGTTTHFVSNTMGDWGINSHTFISLSLTACCYDAYYCTKRLKGERPWGARHKDCDLPYLGSKLNMSPPITSVQHRDGHTSGHIHTRNYLRSL